MATHTLPIHPISSAPLARTPASPWPGRIVTALPVLFLAFDVVIKIIDPPMVAEASAALGLPDSLTPALAIVLASCLALYLAPRTAPVGAVLLTGYLGGAVLAHARVADPLVTHTLMPVLIGGLLWLGLWLRDTRVRDLLAAR